MKFHQTPTPTLTLFLILVLARARARALARALARTLARTLTLTATLLWLVSPVVVNAQQDSLPYNPEADPDPIVVPAPAPDLPAPDGPVSDEPTLPNNGGGVFSRGTDVLPPVVDEPLPDIDCSADAVCREPGTGLPFRVLPRALSNLYKAKQVDVEAIAQEGIPALTPLYVFAREDMDLSDPAAPKGWYRVSATEAGPPLGWLQAADAVEWRQALVVAYIHPGSGEEERQRVLMFRNLQDLQQLVESEDRELQAVGIYDLIDKGQVPGVLVSMEPKKFVDINESFYLMPIVAYQQTEIDGDDAYYLRVAAAVLDERGADVLDDPEFRQRVQQAPDLRGDEARDVDVDIVFVMDMTRSMQPYIDRTREAVEELARTVIAREGLQQRVRFGLIGYRDDVTKIPALMFTAKNFTPELLAAEPFIDMLRKEAKATRIGSVDYAEEVYAGVDLAQSAPWREGALRFVILIGDASAHPPGHPQSTTGKDAPTLHQELVDHHIHLSTLHLRDPRMGNDHPIAEAQFSSLSQIRGSDEVALWSVDTEDAEDKDSFRVAVQEMAHSVITSIDDEPGGSGGGADAPASPRGIGAALRRAALVEYLGRDAKPPKDVLAWVFDRDLTNPVYRSLEVRVLISRAQLSSLIQAMERVKTVMERQTEEQIELFDVLQGLAAATMKNPDDIAGAEKLAQSGHFPEFLARLPYRSEILNLTRDDYGSFTAEQRAAMYDKIKAKLSHYYTISETTDIWQQLNPGDPDGSKVHPLHLSYLP